MRTSAEYREGLYQMRPNVFVLGERVNRKDSRLQPMINLASHSFDVAMDPETAEHFTTISDLTGEKVNRFGALYRTKDDLAKKLAGVRYLTRRTGACALRCAAVDTLNAYYTCTYEVDQAMGTEYHQRFKEWLTHVQKNDLLNSILMTDPKGDRSLRPSQQSDPDSYLRVVEKNAQGIVVNGCKYFANTIIMDELLVGTTRAYTEADAEYAVAFAIPADADGITIITKMIKTPTRSKLDCPFAQQGVSVDTMTFFENVFVPWERVFLCGEWQFGRRLTMLQSLNHRFSYCGCKPGFTDILFGACALVAEYNNLESASHIKSKLAHLAANAEIIYSCGLAAVEKACVSPAGTIIPDITSANIGRYHASVTLYSDFELLNDVAGGLGLLVPDEENYLSPEVGPIVQKYLKRKDGVPPENIWRLWKFINDYIFSEQAGNYMAGGLQGGGSPIMDEIVIMAEYDIQLRKDLAKWQAGIPGGRLPDFK